MAGNIAPILTGWQLDCINRAVSCTWTYRWSEKRIAEYWLQLAYKLVNEMGVKNEL